MRCCSPSRTRRRRPRSCCACLVRALGRKRFGDERHYVLKLSSWNVHALALFRRAFPAGAADLAAARARGSGGLAAGRSARLARRCATMPPPARRCSASTRRSATPRAFCVAARGRFVRGGPRHSRPALVLDYADSAGGRLGSGPRRCSASRSGADDIARMARGSALCGEGPGAAPPFAAAPQARRAVRRPAATQRRVLRPTLRRSGPAHAVGAARDLPAAHLPITAEARAHRAASGHGADFLYAPGSALRHASLSRCSLDTARHGRTARRPGTEEPARASRRRRPRARRRAGPYFWVGLVLVCWRRWRGGCTRGPRRRRPPAASAPTAGRCRSCAARRRKATSR